MTIRLKRVYDKPTQHDGRRILVDRLWPRGLAKAATRIHFWARTLAPSTELRRWYGHDRQKWAKFQQRYFAELDANPAGVAELLDQLGSGTVTFVYATKEKELNNAAALKDYVEARRRPQ